MPSLEEVRHFLDDAEKYLLDKGPTRRDHGLACRAETRMRKFRRYGTDVRQAPRLDDRRNEPIPYFFHAQHLKLKAFSLSAFGWTAKFGLYHGSQRFTTRLLKSIQAHPRLVHTFL